MTSFEPIMDAAGRWVTDQFRPRDLTAAPSRHLVVLACMDARLDLFRLLGLEVGDAHILRNAGGRASDDALRSITVSAAALGTREVVVVHHTECGLAGTSNEVLRGKVRDVSGDDPGDLDFLPFDDLEASVRDDVERIRRWPYLPPEMVVWGTYYDVATGVLHVVDPPPGHGGADG